MKSEILLESGTNELEIIEFRIDEMDSSAKMKPCHYGVNVAKVREIINLPRLTAVPDSPYAVAGIATLRDHVVTIVDMAKLLGKGSEGLKATKVIVMEFNNIQVGIMVHSVSRIHRISWAHVEPPVSIAEGSKHPEMLLQAVAVATVGNTLGGMTSYLLGRLIPNRADGRAVIWLHRYGYWALLFSWIPLFGDALCVGAGWLRFNPYVSLLLFAAGKLFRYALVAGGWAWIEGAVLPLLQR